MKKLVSFVKKPAVIVPVVITMVLAGCVILAKREKATEVEAAEDEMLVDGE